MNGRIAANRAVLTLELTGQWRQSASSKTVFSLSAPEPRSFPRLPESASSKHIIHCIYSDFPRAFTNRRAVQSGEILGGDKNNCATFPLLRRCFLVIVMD